jgi:hypothetical protein
VNDYNLSGSCASEPLVDVTKPTQGFVAIVQCYVSRRTSAFQLLQGNIYPLRSLEGLKSDAVLLQEPAPHPLRADSMLTKIRVGYTGFDIAPDKRKRLFDKQWCAVPWFFTLLIIKPLTISELFDCPA